MSRRPLDVSPVRLLDAAVIGNVFALRVDSVDLKRRRPLDKWFNLLLELVYLEAELGERIVAVLVDDALGAFEVLLLRGRFPPLGQVAVRSELATLFHSRIESELFFF